MSEESPKFSEDDLKGIIGIAVVGAVISWLAAGTIIAAITGAIIGAIVGATVFVVLARPDWFGRVNEESIRPLIFRVFYDVSISELLKEFCWTGSYPGFHEGEWKYEYPGNCTQIRICEHCGETSRKIKHNWSQWFEESYSVSERICMRCKMTERRERKSGPM